MFLTPEVELFEHAPTGEIQFGRVYCSCGESWMSVAQFTRLTGRPFRVPMRAESGPVSDGAPSTATPEQKARDLLERLSGAESYADPQTMSAGDICELADLIADAEHMRRLLPGGDLFEAAVGFAADVGHEQGSIGDLVDTLERELRRGLEGLCSARWWRTEGAGDV